MHLRYDVGQGRQRLERASASSSAQADQGPTRLIERGDGGPGEDTIHQSTWRRGETPREGPLEPPRPPLAVSGN